MKTTNVIETVFGSTGRITVLRRLAKAPQPLTGRQVAELAGLTHRGAIQALVPLVETGVVKQRQVGKAYQYTLAKENIIVEKVIQPVLKTEEQLLNLIKDELIKIFSSDTLSLVLFGSFARGDETWQSDVDVLAVTDTLKKKEEVDRLVDSTARKFREKFGAQLSVHSLTLRELRNKRKIAFLRQVREEGIPLSGKSIDELSKKHA